MKCYITAESFGSDIPADWEQIAAEMNALIDELGIADDINLVNELWDQHWN